MQNLGQSRDQPLYFNTFVPNAPFLYPLKTSENLTVLWCFQGAEKSALGTNGLIKRYSSKSHSSFLDYNMKLSHCHADVTETTVGADLVVCQTSAIKCFEKKFIVLNTHLHCYEWKTSKRQWTNCKRFCCV